MPAKLMAMTFVAVCFGSALLVLRQHRIELAHRSARLHHRIETARHEVWRDQTEAAALLKPDRLRGRIDQVRIAFEPAVPRMPPSGGVYARRP